MDQSNIMWLTLASSQYRGSSYPRWSIATSGHSLVWGCSFIKNFYLQLDVCWWACEPPTMSSTMLQWPTMTTTKQTFCLVFSDPETAPAEGESPYPLFVLGRNTSNNPVMQCGSHENVILSQKTDTHSNLVYVCGVHRINYLQFIQIGPTILKKDVFLNSEKLTLMVAYSGSYLSSHRSCS